MYQWVALRVQIARNLWFWRRVEDLFFVLRVDPMMVDPMLVDPMLVDPMLVMMMMQANSMMMMQAYSMMAMMMQAYSMILMIQAYTMLENMRKKVEGLVQIFKEEAVSESRMTDINKYVLPIILARKTNDFENELIDFPKKTRRPLIALKSYKRFWPKDTDELMKLMHY